MSVRTILRLIGELGFIVVKKNGEIVVTQPTMNVHHSRLQSFIQFIVDYKYQHPEFRFRGYFTLYDAWREHAEPSENPDFVFGNSKLLKLYVGRGTIGEPGRFIQPYSTKDTFPVFYHPVLAFGRHKNDPYTKLIPDTDFIKTQGYKELRTIIDGSDVEWQNKVPKLFWRGSMHGFPYQAYDPDNKRCQRKLLVDWSSRFPDICDAQSSHTAPKQEQLSYKYLIDIDGEVNAWSGLFWKLYSNSVVFKVDSHYEQWYYKGIKPWMHYIPVKGDLSDLDSQFEWAKQHDQECRQIAENGRAFAMQLTYEKTIVTLTFDAAI